MDEKYDKNDINDMKEIKNQEFGGERPLYCEHDLYLENVVIHAGESAIKETSDITAVNCRFEGKYPFWCCDRFTVKNCISNTFENNGPF